jgi:hypothetical protein
VTATTEPNLALVPGAMEHTKTRVLPNGTLVEFDQAPVGWLTKKGEPRKKEWRAYHVTPPEGKRERQPSVTTILDSILPKPGLPPWSEARGIEGAVEAVARGLIEIPEGRPLTDEEFAEAVQIVRAHRLGADRARDDAADRGLNVHTILEDWMTTGEPPNPADHPRAHHGYIRGLFGWILANDPEPVVVEQLVAHPERGYAGRMDLRCLLRGRLGGPLTTVDLKTQERGSIYSGAHYQTRLYEDAEVAAGGDPADRLLVVVVDAQGGHREMECAVHDATPALTFAAEVRPVDSACESQNRAIRQALKAAA